MITEDFVAERLAQVRIAKNISARDLSLSIGQSKSYINNIENKKSNISMPMFLYVCDYLQISPKDFFDENIAYPTQMTDLIDNLKQLNESQLLSINNLVKEIIKE